MDPVDTEYFEWNPEGSPFSVHMQLDAIDGIARDVLEGVKILPRHGLEVGGLLLGRIGGGDRPDVWVERYQRIQCQHRFGPQFILDDQDRSGLEAAAANILENRDLAIVGVYRSHIRPGLQLEGPDLDLINRYFSDPTDLVLLIKSDEASDPSARFYARDAQPIGEVFAFRGHRVGAGMVGPAPEVIAEIPEVKAPDEPAKAVAEDRSPEPPVEDPPAEEDTDVKTAQSERPRRLVPDFVPAPVEPPRREPLPGPRLEERYAHLLEPEAPTPGERLKKWVPLIAALLLVGGLLWFMLQPSRRGSSSVPPPQASAEPGRPLGLAVEPMGAMWQLSWNPSATALQEARSVQLFVREGDDQNRYDLAQKDLATGTYQYKPAGNDVTFRLEVTDRSGHVSAESFRLSRAAAPAANPLTPPAAKQPAPPAPQTSGGRLTLPKAIHKAPPVVAAGIRPRIKGMIPIDVRVQIDSRGRVTSASPVTKQRSGLEAYLATCAVKAARLWRFEPARENGQPVSGTSTIHFVFEK